MAKKQGKKKAKKEQPKKKQKKKETSKRKTLQSKPKKTSKKERQALTLESRDIWQKNLVLALILIVIVVLNGWLYFRGEKIEKPEEQLSKQQENLAGPSDVNANTNAAPQDNLDGLNDEEKRVVQELLAKQELESWKDYKNTAYSFILKYPGDWADPVPIKPEDGQKFSFKVSFRNGATEEKDQKGFYIYIYRPLKVKNYIQPDYSDNLVKKDTAEEDYSNCFEIGTVSIGENNYPAMEMYHLQNDPCFSEAYFLVLGRGAFLFDIVPIPQGGKSYSGYDGRRKVAETLPEFRKMLNTFNFIQIAAKKTTVVKRITAPKPQAKTKNVGGKRVCAKKNDKPRKSKQHKKKHMDMECCLDPDEYPNPWCTY